MAKNKCATYRAGWAVIWVFRGRTSLWGGGQLSLRLGGIPLQLNQPKPIPTFSAILCLTKYKLWETQTHAWVSKIRGGQRALRLANPSVRSSCPWSENKGEKKDKQRRREANKWCQHVARDGMWLLTGSKKMLMRQTNRPRTLKGLHHNENGKNNENRVQYEFWCVPSWQCKLCMY